MSYAIELSDAHYQHHALGDGPDFVGDLSDRLGLLPQDIVGVVHDREFLGINRHARIVCPRIEPRK